MKCKACERRAEAIRNLRVKVDHLRRDARLPSSQHSAWERLMYGTPAGASSLPVYQTRAGHVVVCGTPVADDPRHDCDSMGCSSVSHVLWRGTMRAFVETMTAAAEAHETEVTG